MRSLIFCLILLAAIDFSLCKANFFSPPQVISICVKGDGSIEPANMPLENACGNRYILNGDISPQPSDPLFNRSIYGTAIEKDNIVLDGANHTISGSEGIGIVINYRDNVTVTNMVIKYFHSGIAVYGSSNVNITSTQYHIIAHAH